MVWTNVFFFQFPGIKQKPGKGNFRDLKSQNITGGACPRAPLEACSLGPSFRKSVSIYPRSAPDLVAASTNIGLYDINNRGTRDQTRQNSTKTFFWGGRGGDIGPYGYQR